MAYGNWGAWVFRNGVNMPNWEDQTPYEEESRESGYHQAFNMDGKLGVHHAVLGGNEVRLCGYKNYPALFVRMEAVDLDAYKTSDGDVWADGTWEGEVAGYRFKAEQFNDNMIDLWLLEPDDTRWSARCGYCYGAGHDDRSPRDEAGAEWPWTLKGA